jgi:hypothetical protein
MSVGKKLMLDGLVSTHCQGTHSSLLRIIVNFGRKSFITVEPGVLRILDYSEKDFLGMVDQLI